MYVQWKCETQLDPSCQLQEIKIVFEGYDYPGDPYVLKGTHTVR